MLDKNNNNDKAAAPPLRTAPAGEEGVVEMEVAGDHPTSGSGSASFLHRRLGNDDKYHSMQFAILILLFSLGIIIGYIIKGKKLQRQREQRRQQESSLALRVRGGHSPSHAQRNDNNNANTSTANAGPEEEEGDSVPILAERQKFVTKYLESKEWTGPSTKKKKRTGCIVVTIGSSSSEEEECSRITTTTSCCSICLNSFQKGDKVSTSTNNYCQHIFHYDCVYKWLLKKKECPMCRNIFLLPTPKTTLAADHHSVEQPPSLEPDIETQQQQDVLDNDRGSAGGVDVNSDEQEQPEGYQWRIIPSFLTNFFFFDDSAATTTTTTEVEAMHCSPDDGGGDHDDSAMEDTV